jgi:hypothetical protein
MIDKGSLSNAKMAIAALAAFKENVTDLNEKLKTKEGVLVPASYYETSDLPKYKAAIKYFDDTTEEDILKMSEAELVYAGLKKVVSSINSQKSLTREDANFLHDAIFPYMFVRMNTFIEMLKKDSIGKADKLKIEKSLLNYVSGVNLLSEVMLAAPGMVTMGLYSPDSFKAKIEDILEQVNKVVTNKAKFNDCFKDHESSKDLYDFTDDVKADLFLK